MDRQQAVSRLKAGTPITNQRELADLLTAAGVAGIPNADTRGTDGQPAWSSEAVRKYIQHADRARPGGDVSYR